MLTGIDEIKLVSVNPRHIRAVHQLHGELAHLLSPLLHHLDHRSSIAS
jgi:hypothetical protein